MKPLPPKVEAQRMKLYRKGLTDGEIAKACGATTDAICHWRISRKLPRNASKNLIAPPPPPQRRNYRQILPPDMWPKAEMFLGLIYRAKSHAEKTGKQGNIDLPTLRRVWQEEMAR